MYKVYRGVHARAHIIVIHRISELIAASSILALCNNDCRSVGRAWEGDAGKQDVSSVM